MQTNSKHWLQSAHSTHLPLLLGLSAPAPHVPPHGTPPFPNPSCARFPRQLSQRRSSTAPYRRARPSGAAPRCSPRAAAPRPSAPPRALPHGLQPRPGALRPSDRIHRCPRAPPRPLAGIGSARRPRAAGHGPLLSAPLLGRRELPLRARGASCPHLGACGAVSHISLLSPSCCCTAVTPSLQPALSEHIQRRSGLSSGRDGAVMERLELL